MRHIVIYFFEFGVVFEGNGCVDIVQLVIGNVRTGGPAADCTDVFPLIKERHRKIYKSVSALVVVGFASAGRFEGCVTCRRKASRADCGVLARALAENGVVAGVDDDVAERIQHAQIHPRCLCNGVQSQCKLVQRYYLFESV